MEQLLGDGKGKKGVLKIRKSFIAGLALVIILILSGFAAVRQNSPQALRLCSGQAKAEAIKEVGEPVGVVKREADVNKPLGSGLNEQEIVESACALIEQGKFDAAGQLLDATAGGDTNAVLVGQLKEVIGEWRQLEKRRLQGREAAYKEQLAAFEKVKAGKPADINASDGNDAEDVNGSTSLTTGGSTPSTALGTG